MVESDRIIREVAEAMRLAVENNTGYFDGGPEVNWYRAAEEFLAAAEENARRADAEEAPVE